MKQGFTMRLLLCALGVALVASVSLAAGCGDDDGGGGGGDTTRATGQTNANEGSGNANQGGGGAGNGSGKEGGGSKATGPSAEFIEEAEAICEQEIDRTNREFSDYTAEIEGSRNEAKAYSEVTARVIVPRLESRIRRLKALDVPPGAEEAADAVVSRFEQVLETAEADPVGFQSAAGGALVKDRRKLKRIGFSACAGYLG